MKKVVVAVMILFYLLHNDYWLWNDGRLFGGIPAGLLYHIGYCIAAALLMLLLIRFAWPVEPEKESGAEEL